MFNKIRIEIKHIYWLTSVLNKLFKTKILKINVFVSFLLK